MLNLLSNHASTIVIAGLLVVILTCAARYLVRSARNKSASGGCTGICSSCAFCSGHGCGTEAKTTPKAAPNKVRESAPELSRQTGRQSGTPFSKSS